MDADADVPVVADLGLAHVQAHPHLDLDSSAPLVRGQLSLSVGRCGHGVSSRLERSEERISLRVDDATLVGRDRSTQETLVVGEHLA